MSPPLISKAAARYTGAGGKEHCSLCRHFSPRRGGRCARVLGDISPMGWCRLFSREMRGLVADASSFNGGGGGPALGLDFMTPGVLDPRITFTRASTGTYFDSAGVMRSAAVNAPRWDYDPATMALRGLLIEDARTNSMLQSGDFTNAAWTKGAGATLSAGTPGPNGPTTGSGLISANAAIGFLAQAYTPAAGTAITMSCFVKAGSLSSVVLLMPAGWWADATNRVGTYDLAAGIVSSVTGGTATGTIQPVGNGWYRISMTATPNAAALSSAQFARATANGNGVAVQYYVFGAQIEVGAFATSYVPTTSAAVTRAVDAASMLTTGWINPLAGTLLVESSSPESPAVGANREFVGIGTDGSNIIRLAMTNTVGYLSSNVFTANVSRGGVSDNRVWPAGVFFKCAITYNATGLALSLASGGTAPGTAVATALPASFTTLWIGGGGRGSTASAPYRRVAYWNRVLSNAELQTVTTP